MIMHSAAMKIKKIFKLIFFLQETEKNIVPQLHMQNYFVQVKPSVGQDYVSLSCIPATVESSHDLHFRSSLIPFSLSQARNIK